MRLRPTFRVQGFTLVEMLIALTIFGMLTAAGVALLSVSARTQQTSQRLLDELGELRTAQSLLTADLAQAVPRVHRNGLGQPVRAFSARSGAGVLMALIRGGWDSGEPGRSSLQRVEYRFREGRLERWSYPHVDGEGEPVVVTLLAGVRQLRLRLRDAEGGWHNEWAPTDGAELPSAAELVTDTEAHGLVRQLFLVGAAR